jgi:hypothetical protein
MVYSNQLLSPYTSIETARLKKALYMHLIGPKMRSDPHFLFAIYNFKWIFSCPSLSKKINREVCVIKHLTLKLKGIFFNCSESTACFYPNNFKAHVDTSIVIENITLVLK